MGRLKKRPGFDPEKVMQELMDVVTGIYSETGELSKTAEEIGLSPLKVRKILITAGVFINDTLTCVVYPHNQLRCNKCGATRSQYISYKAEGHRITKELFNYVYDLLATGNYTNKEVASLAGLHQAVVKSIDKKRLLEKYTFDGKQYKKPKQMTEYLGIDEFKLHDGHKFATHIIDPKTGHILFIAEGKKKRVVYNFIRFVGQEWMKHVKAVACDMNSDYAEAFTE